MNSELPIGVFDSGVGGLTVACSLRRQLPDEALVYFGDTARCPYGDKSPQDVRSFAREVCKFLYEYAVKVLVVACNTATAVALADLQAEFPIPVVGVIEPGAWAATEATQNRRVAVIGTSVTIASGAYEQAVRSLLPTAEVASIACPEFVPLVESGRVSGEEVEQVVRSSLEPILRFGMDTLILGCTHYPHLTESIQAVVGPSVRLINSAEETARHVDRVLTLRDSANRSEHRPGDVYFTTGNGLRMREAVERWIGAQEANTRVEPVVLGSVVDSKTGS